MSEKSVVTGQRGRIIMLALAFLCAGLYLLCRLAHWQWREHPEIVSFGAAQRDRPTEITAGRGNILDATGHYLVASTLEYEISLTPAYVQPKDRAPLIWDLADILIGADGYPVALALQYKANVSLEQVTRETAPQFVRDMERIVEEPVDQPEKTVARIVSRVGSVSILLGKGLPAAIGQQIDNIDSGDFSKKRGICRDAFSIRTSTRRVYADGPLAASLLGFVDHMNENKGRYGLEERYEYALKGQEGRWYGIHDLGGKQVLLTQKGYQPVKDGVDLLLTLDRNIQHRAETILREGINAHGAASGNIIVMDCRTGGILAMANAPTYDPADYGDPTTQQWHCNTAISAVYEPGSVFKPLTLAAALDAHVIRPDDTYDDRGEIWVGQQCIRNSDELAHGRTTMTEILAYSRNVGAAYVAAQLGEARFYEYVRKFGFGEVTGIDLAHEVRGFMRVPGQPEWHKSDLVTNSFGQGISVTPLQIVAAYGALANGGVLMRPHVVAGIQGESDLETTKPFRVLRVIAPEAAQQITQMMADSLEMGMKEAVLPGYRFAGKSGTAEIPDQEGYDSREKIIASFVGFGPIPNPRFVVLVRFDAPTTGYWGLEVAGPEFSKMNKYLVDYYGIPPTS